MDPSTIYLISGANRGIGLALVTNILINNPTAYVYAGARSPDTATALHDLRVEHAERLSIVKLVSADILGNKTVAEDIARAHGRVDTVIANAATCSTYGRVDSVDPKGIDEHFHVNVTGTIVLFQAVVSILRMSASPRFIPISSSAGQLSGRVVTLNFGSVAYSSSKAALNWVARKMHFENEWLVVFPVCPGPVNTDMFRANLSKDDNGAFPYKQDESSMRNVPTAEGAAAALLKIINASTREEVGGKFIRVPGDEIAW